MSTDTRDRIREQHVADRVHAHLALPIERSEIIIDRDPETRTTTLVIDSTLFDDLIGWPTR